MNQTTKLFAVVLTFCLLFFNGSHLEAQSPQGINYQAVARDADGNPITNTIVNARFSLLSGSANGSLVWEETHSTNANSLGLFNLVIGEGTNTGGSATSFSDIEWSNDDHFLKVEVDFGSGYNDMGTTQFLSVPYALSAQSVVDMPVMGLDDLDDVNTSGASNGDVLQWDGNNWIPAAVSGGGGGAPSGPAGGDLSGNYPNPTIAQMGASSGQVLQWDGSAWTPEDASESKWSEDGSDIYYDNGKVGIGTDEPYTKLHVESGDDMAGSIAGEIDGENATLTLVNPTGSGSGAMTGIRFNVSSVSNTGAAIAFERTGGQSQGRLHFGTKSSTIVSNEIPIRMTISEDGYVGIGTVDPDLDLHIKQSVANRGLRIEHQSDTDYWNMGIGTGSKNLRFEFNGLGRGQISSTDGTYSTISDASLKTNIQSMNSVLAKVGQMRPTTYEFKDDEDKNLSIGFISQEVEKLFPELVSESDEGLKLLNYSHFSVIAIKAIQEQQAIIEAQSKELEKIKQLLKDAGYSID